MTIVDAYLTVVLGCLFTVVFVNWIGTKLEPVSYRNWKIMRRKKDDVNLVLDDEGASDAYNRSTSNHFARKGRQPA